MKTLRKIILLLLCFIFSYSVLSEQVAKLKINNQGNDAFEGIYLNSLNSSLDYNADLYAMREEGEVENEFLISFYSYNDFSVLYTNKDSFDKVNCKSFKEEEYDNNANAVVNKVYCIISNNRELLFKIKVLDIGNEYVTISYEAVERQKNEEIINEERPEAFSFVQKIGMPFYMLLDLGLIALIILVIIKIRKYS